MVGERERERERETERVREDTGQVGNKDTTSRRIQLLERDNL